MPHDVITSLLDAGRKYPDRIALRQGSTAYSYAEFSSSITTIAANLQSRGIQQGDRFLFSVRPNAAGFLFMLGIIASGGVVVVADPAAAPSLFETRIKLTNPKYAAAESKMYMESNPLFKSVMNKRGVNTPNYRELPVKHFYSGKRLPGTPLNAVHVSKLLKQPRTVMVPADPTGDSIIAFTADTPEQPKALTHSRASLGSSMQAYVDLCGVTEESLIYTDHFVCGVTAIMCGGEWEIPVQPPASDAALWLDRVLDRKPTHTFLSPTDATTVLDEIERRGGLPDGVNPLGTLAMGASPGVSPLIQRIHSLLPETRVLAIHGMTEILPVAVVEGAGDIAYVNGDLAGGIIFGATPRVDSIEDEDSELVLSGDNLMLDHLIEENSAETGTADYVPLADDSQIEQLGRMKGMLIRGGKNIYPGLYEPGITQLNGISSCAIVGVPDKYGEDIVALVVVPEHDEQNIQRLQRKVEAHLSHVMDADALPDVVIVQDELPLSGPSGKPNRLQLRKDVSAHPDVESLLKERAKNVA